MTPELDRFQAAQKAILEHLKSLCDAGVFDGVFGADDCGFAVRLTEYLSPFEAVPGAGAEWHPRVSLLGRRTSSRPDDARVLADILPGALGRTGRPVAIVRHHLARLRHLGVIKWDGTESRLYGIRFIVQDGPRAELPGVVIPFPKRRRTVQVRAS